MSSPRRKWVIVAGVLAGGTAGALLYLKPFAERTAPPADVPLLAAADTAESRTAKTAAAEPARSLSQPSRPELSLAPPPQAAQPARPPVAERPAVPPPAQPAASPVPAQTTGQNMVTAKPAMEPAAPSKQPAPKQVETTPGAQSVEPAQPVGESPFAVRPPQLPTEFPRDAAGPAAVASPSREATEPAPAAAPLMSVTPGITPPRGVTVRPAPRERLHVVRDGDTLSRLAERYLGDSRRRLEIFADNRQVLHNPDVLPIGAKLRIVTGPPRIVETVVDVPEGARPDLAGPSAAGPSAAPRGTIAGGAASGALQGGQGPRPLVPLPPGAFADRAP